MGKGLPRSERRVVPASLLVAAAAHALIAAAFATYERSAPTPEPRVDHATAESAELELELESTRPAPSPTRAEPSASPANAMGTPSTERWGVTAAISNGAPSSRLPSSADTELALPSAAPSTSPETPLMIVAPALGISGRNPFLASASSPEAPTEGSRTSRPEAKSAAEAKQAVEQSMKAETRARDVNVGLGPEGPVVHALIDATYGSFAPERGSAMFLAVVDGGGIVVDLRLASSNGDQQGWADVRARALRALAGTKLALRGARGAELQIRVTSDVRLPSGSLPGRPIRPALSDSKVVLPQNVPQGGTADVVKTFTISTFDVTDIGAKPRRIVHATLVSLSSL